MHGLRRLPFPTCVFLALVALLLTCVARPAQASTLTLSFHGFVDLGSFGGVDDTPFSGSLAWDPSTLPFDTFLNPPAADYNLFGSTFSLNGNAVTNQIAGGQFVRVSISAGEWLLGTVFNFSLSLSPGGITSASVTLRGTALAAPGLPTTALPTNLDFLRTMGLETISFSPHRDLVFGDITGSVCEVCSRDASVVPEPTTLMLLPLGMIGVAARLRRSGRAS